MPQLINPLGHYICDCGMTWDGNAQHWDCPTLDEGLLSNIYGLGRKETFCSYEMANYFYTHCALYLSSEKARKKLQNYKIFWNKLKK